MKSLAIIILNWNGLKLLKEFLPAAVRDCISEDTDLFVADNGSEDGSVEFIKHNFPEVKIIRFDKNYGFAEGYNKAIAVTDYPFTILLNSDVETTPGFWKPMLKYMKEHNDVGAAQPKLLSYRNKEYFEYAGGAGGFLDNLGYPYCRGRIMDVCERDEGQFDDGPSEITWATGACIMVRTELYLRIGGLDKHFFAHMEEIDLCCRMKSAGYKIVALPDSVVYHLGGASLPKDNPKKTFLNFRNNLLLLYKNLPAKRGRKILFIRRMADTLAFVMFLLKGQTGDAKAILKAHSEFKKMRKLYYPAAEGIKSPLEPNSIILDYYLRGKKRFNDLKK